MYCPSCGSELEPQNQPQGVCPACGESTHRRGLGPWPALFVMTLVALVFMVIVHVTGSQTAADVTALSEHEPASNLPVLYELPARYGAIGPRLIEAGAIDRSRFIANYDEAGRPLDAFQRRILDEGSSQGIVISEYNAYFLLNLFWALGLSNDNTILKKGPMMTVTDGDPSRLASVGGWTLGRKPPTELYASSRLVPLTTGQQARVEQVAASVYRPCCNNHTAFPDCNHGMALLGMLQYMAGQDATTAELYDAAKYVSAFWFPRQAEATAAFFEQNMNLDYAEVEPRRAVGRQAFSGEGFKRVQQWLAANGAAQRPSGGGGSGCSV